MMTAATAATVAGGMKERSGTSEGEGSLNAVRPSGCCRPTANGLMGFQLQCGLGSGLV